MHYILKSVIKISNFTHTKNIKFHAHTKNIKFHAHKKYQISRTQKISNFTHKNIKFLRTQKISNFHAHKKYQIFMHTKNIKLVDKKRTAEGGAFYKHITTPTNYNTLN
jgi:hypothetical protein